MTINFRPAVRAGVNLIIALAGGTGSGKTFSAMRLASGMAGVKRFAVIDTENGRASHYADRFAFDVTDLRAPFTPERYEEAILAADAAGYPVIVVDSMSHEYTGDGGLLDMQVEEFERMGSREAVKLMSWIKPKMAHRRMLTKLLQIRAQLILCFRAEPKIEVVKENGMTKIVPKESLAGYAGWIPVTEKNMPYEATVSFMFTADKPGVPHPIKLQEQHAPMFRLDEPIGEESGSRIAQWAAGDVAPAPATAPTAESFRQRIVDSADRAALRRVTRDIAAAKMNMKPSEVEGLRAAVIARQGELGQRAPAAA